MMRSAVFLAALSSALLLAPSVARATTREKITVTCPVCQEKVEGWTIGSTNNFGGKDRDFLEWAGGDQPILYYPITCTKCFYSGYEDDFGADAKVPDDVAKRIREEKALKPIEEAASGPPDPWVRYDLIAQTYVLLGRDHRALAWQYLRAVWASRIQKAFVSRPFDGDTLEALDAWIAEKKLAEGENADRAQAALAIAGKCEAMLAEAKGEDARMAGITAILLYRIHGENTAALRVLAVAKPHLGEESAARLEKDLPPQVERERALQKRALAEFEVAVGEEKYPGEKAGMTYLCGELCRRVEEWERARAFYEAASALPGAADGLKGWCREQAALLPPK